MEEKGPGRATELSLSNPGAAELPPGSYWETHRYIGEVALAPHSKVLVNTVLKEGGWYVRLRAYRLARRGAGEEWVPARQIMVFPPRILGDLRNLLAAAEQAIETAPLPSQNGLTREELDQELAAELPDREAMSLVNTNIAVPINAAVAANVLSDGSIAYANAEQDVTIDQSTD